MVPPQKNQRLTTTKAIGRAAAPASRLDIGTAAYARARLLGIPAREALARYQPAALQRALDNEDGYSTVEASILAAVRRVDRETNRALVQAARSHGLASTGRALRLIPRLATGEFDIAGEDVCADPPEPDNAGPAVPSLDELADMYPDFGEDELVEQREQLLALAAQDAGRAPVRASPRERRLRIALRALERLIAQANRPPATPAPTDSLARWLAPRVHERLRDARIVTVADLLAAVTASAAWYETIRGLGQGKAARIEQWLRESVPKAAAALAARPLQAKAPAQTPSPALPAAAAGIWESEAFALRPIEYFACPPSPTTTTVVAQPTGPGDQLGARTDREAIEAWLRSLRADNTRRAYTREAERFMLWAHLERAVDLNRLLIDDCTAYLHFAKAPPAAWRAADAAQRAAPRTSTAWRPFGEHPMSDASLAHTRTVLRRMCEWLVSAGYLRANPWRLARQVGSERPRVAAADRHLPVALRDTVLAWADALPCDDSDAPQTALNVRRRLVLRMLFCTGLRREELAHAAFGDIQYSEDETERGYMLRIVGKGQRVRRVPLLPEVVEAIDAEARLRLRRLGEPAEHRPAWTAPALAGRPIVGSLKSPAATSIGHAVIYDELKTAMALIAHELDERGEHERAGLVRAATPHWARHTFGTHGYRATNDLRAVQELLGHANIATTTIYTHVSDAQLVDVARQATARRAKAKQE